MSESSNKDRLHDQLQDWVLRALRTGMSTNEVFQTLTAKAEYVSQSMPLVQAVLDARATDGGRNL